MKRIFLYPKRPYPSASTEKSGFAIVVALALMAFMLLLLLCIASLAGIELHQSGTQIERQSARQNALMALSTALAELQKSTGPDQRVTAVSSILDTDPATSSIEDITEEYWTGVWDVDGNLVTWLVSGNEGLDPLDNDFVRPNTNITDPVSIMADGSVQVPKTRIDNTNAYAFWISDEGVKAKVTKPGNDTDQHPLISAKKIDVSQMTELDWISRLNQDERERAIEIDSLKVGAMNENERNSLDNRQHDLTAYSNGLLTNTLNGGLKQDLTLAIFDNSVMPSGQIFGPHSGAQSFSDPGGPLWTQLRDWALSGSNAVNASGNIVARPSTDSQIGFSPVITQFQIYFVPRYKVDAATQEYKVYLEVYPAITLWNPYDRALDVVDAKIDFGRNFWEKISAPRFYYYGDYYSGALYGWQLIVEGAAGDRKYYYNLSTVLFPGQTSIHGGFHFSLGDVNIAPGQAITYSPPNRDTTAGENEMEIVRTDYSYYPLEPGYRVNACYYMPTDIQYAYDPLDSSTKLKEFVLRAHTSISQCVRLTSGNYVLQQILGLGGVAQPSAAQSALLPLGSNNMDGSVGIQAVRNFSERLGQSGEDNSLKWIAHNNPRATTIGPNPVHFHGDNQTNIQAKHDTNPSYYSSSKLDGDEKDLGLINIGTGQSVNSAYINNTILFETAPGRTQLHSIGQLMHAPLFYSHADTAQGDMSLYAFKTDTGNRLQWARFDNAIPAYAIGNSEADPLVPLNETDVDWDANQYQTGWPRQYALMEGKHYDYSYLLNEKLWDNYFFSSLLAATSRQPDNPRLVPLNASQNQPLESRQVAAEFIVDGAFNVNSTSEEAWRAILAAFFKEEVNAQALDAAPYLRVHDNPGSHFDPSTDDADSPPAYSGYRSLTHEQIENLAHQIVKQNKWRMLGRNHPYTSMTDFVNRDPDSDAPSGLDIDAFRLRGALSSAIFDADQISSAEASKLGISVSEAQINTALAENAYTTTPRSEPEFTQKAQEGWRTENIPGWLTQADLLARLGSTITVRSDTFKIRVYGETRNPLTNTVSTAWGEAIVQRLPDFIDSDSDAPETPLATLASQLNRDFGRRYTLVDFHWITP